MAAWFPSLDLSLSLGRNVLVGVSIGLGIGLGIGAGMAASRRMFTATVQDQKLVVRVTELTEEIRELRCVMVRLEVTFSENRNKRIVPQNDQPPVRQSDEETEEDEYYEMSGEEPSSKYVSYLVQSSLPVFVIVHVAWSLTCSHRQPKLVIWVDCEQAHLLL